MSVRPTHVNPKSTEYQQNYEAMRRLVEEFHARQTQVRAGGSERARERDIEGGELLPRERGGPLLGPCAPFLELSTHSCWDMDNDGEHGGPQITCICVG